MLSKLELTNVKSFRSSTLPLSDFTVLLGTNASGKSNIRDAMRFLHGVGRGYRIIDVLAEKYEGGDRVWPGIRGGPTEFIHSAARSARITATIDTNPGYFEPRADTTYTIELAAGDDPTDLYLQFESLSVGDAMLYTTAPSQTSDSCPVYTHTTGVHVFDRKSNLVLTGVNINNNIPMIGQINALCKNSKDCDDVKVGSMLTRERMMSMRFLDLHPDTMRLPSYPSQTMLGDLGENLSSVLKSVIEKQGKREHVISWLNALTPMDVAEIEFVSDMTGKTLIYLIDSNGTKTSAASASDGTLRFLAYLALLFSEDVPELIFIEDIDSGIHPARLHLLVELIESFTTKHLKQIVATSHSPSLLSFLSKRTLHNALLVYRSDVSGSSKVRPLSELPGLDEVSGRRTAGYLLESDWLDNTASALEYDEQKSAIKL